MAAALEGRLAGRAERGGGERGVRCSLIGPLGVDWATRVCVLDLPNI